MLKHQQTTIVFVIALLAGTSPAFAQGSDAQSAGATGAQARQTDTTWQDVQQMPAYGNYDPGLGNTWTTGTQGVYDFNGPMLPPAATTLEAPKSGMAGGIPSGQFNFGFPNSGFDVYRGAYQGAGNFGGFLPPTSTSSVDIDITGPVNPLPPSSSFLDSPASAPGWGFPGADGGGIPAPPIPFPQQ
jgi:hypothetical protein